MEARQWGMIPVPLISASTPSAAPSAQGKDPWRFPLFAHSHAPQLAGSEKPFEDWKRNDKRSLIFDKKSISNWKCEQRAVQSKFFKAARDRSNCCRFIYMSTLEVWLAVCWGYYTFAMIKKDFFLGQQICSKSSSLKI